MSLAVINVDPPKVKETEMPAMVHSKVPGSIRVTKPLGRSKMEDFDLINSHWVITDKVTREVEGVAASYDIGCKYIEYLADTRRTTVGRYANKLTKAICLS
jgi:hypothetical protein